MHPQVDSEVNVTDGQPTSPLYHSPENPRHPQRPNWTSRHHGVSRLLHKQWQSILMTRIVVIDGCGVEKYQKFW